MTEPTQAVAQDTNVQVTPDTAVAGAQNEEIDLDALLNEWGATGEEAQATEPPKVEPKTDTPPDETKEILNFVKQQMTERQKEDEKRINEEYQKTVSSVKGDLPVPDKVVDGYLRVRAAEDPRILKAYQNRHKSPDAWSKVEKGIQNELRSQIKALPDKGATDTRSQIAGAIQNSQSSSSYQAEKPLKDMTDQEFNQYQQAFISS